MAQTRSNEHEIIIRFSSTWWMYMLTRGGILRILVNGIEDTLAITGRTLLLIFLLYCGVKSGALLVEPDWSPPAWLEMGMFVLQLAGLEGSIPGLARYADALHRKEDKEGAKNIERVMRSARIMTTLTIGEGVLHLFGIDPQLLRVISGILLVVRGVVITSFLMQLAKIDAKGPRIVSKDEHSRELQARHIESEQARTIDDLRFQLHRAETVLTTSLQQSQQQQHEQASLIKSLRDQSASLEKIHSATIASVDGQAQMLTDVQNRLDSAEKQVQKVTALLEQKCREFETANAALHTAKLQLAVCKCGVQNAEGETAKPPEQTANLQIAHMQNAKSGTAKLAEQTAKMQAADMQNAEGKTAKLSEQTPNLHNITSLDQARTKHDADDRGKIKVRHTDVLAFIAAHPNLTRAEVAARLGISNRKVYDVIARRRDQEPAATSAH